MVIFHSYVSLPEGITEKFFEVSVKLTIVFQIFQVQKWA